MKQKTKYLSILILLLGFIYTANAQYPSPEDLVDWTFSVRQNDCEATITAELTIQEGWHINSIQLPENNFGIPTTFTLQKSNDFRLVGQLAEPKPLEGIEQVTGEFLRYHIGTIELKQKIKVTTNKDFTLSFNLGFQTCNSEVCLFPYEETFTIKIKGCS